MSIQSEINRLSGNVGNTLSALRNTGTNVPSGANSDSMAGLVSQYAGEVMAGKALVAAAVTEKGVETPADATFQQIAENVAAIVSGGGPTYAWVDIGAPSIEGSSFSKEYVFRYSAPSPGWAKLVFIYLMQENTGLGGGDFLGADGESLLQRPNKYFSHTIDGENITSKCSVSIINRNLTYGYAIFLY